MDQLWLMLAIFGLWIVLNRWVLPWLGIPTCMSGQCGRDCSTRPDRAEPANNDLDVTPSKGN